MVPEPDADRARPGTGLSALLRERRVSAGMTQRELAAAAGVSIGALRDLEQGRTRCPRWGAVAAIATALGMSRHQRAELASAWSGGHPDDGGGYAAAEAESWTGAVSVRIGALGALTVRRDGAAVRLGSPRQRAVLGLLALHWPAGVPRDVMVDVLWGERPPGRAAADVQAYVSRLRRLLDPRRTACGRTERDEPGRHSGDSGDGGPVMLAGRWYRLGDGMRLDLAEFGELSRHADGAAAQGEFRLACALYERSLGLWRGEVVADVDLLQGYPAAAEATRRRVDVVLRFACAAAAAGGHGLALPHLRNLCAREPFNEQAHAYLMAALAAIGQQAAAVRLFGELRHRLDRELGIRPGRQVAATHVRILRQQAG